MSYILEALRKADAERERGAVPDLHAQLLPGGPAEDEAAPGRAARWLGPLLGAAVVLVGVAAWRLLGADVAPVAATPPAAALPPVAVVQPKPVPAQAATSGGAATVMPASAAMSSATVDAMPAASAPVPVPTPSRPSAPKLTAKRAQAEAPVASAAESVRAVPSAKPTPKDGKSAAKPADATPGAADMSASPAMAPPARLPKLNELPDEYRQQVPALAVGGSVYSPQADKRMVIVNGQVFLEGAQLAPELRLEQIRPKSAVLSIRGQRFELPL